MIDRRALLADLQTLLRSLEADLLDRADSDEVPEVRERLEAEYEKAREGSRTAQNYEDWLNAYLTQIAAAWVLSAVFVRFLEDNQLIDPPRIAGPKDRLQRAWDEHELYFGTNPTETDREYLLDIFSELARLPGGGEVFGPHNPIHELPNWLGPDAAGELLRFFQKRDADTGELIHDFTDAQWDTRFLGDLYQDLSEAARKRYALLQTPEFVEEFILDRTLDPALDEFGLDAPPVKNQDGDEIAPAGFRMIDPACGSGHFLLGAFHRILDRWRRTEPSAKDRDLVQRALDSVHGVDVNPFAIAIARFRLLLAALRESGITRLKDAPAFHFNLAAGDALLHGVPGTQHVMDFHELAHHYRGENAKELHGILNPCTYHAVVANPPYITVSDRALNTAYRARFTTCFRRYSLVCPFFERLFMLGIGSPRAGFVGAIVSNAFMKREFGKALVESFIPQIDLTHLVDAAGAYIPGHGTPTLIVFGRARPPVGGVVRAVQAIRGEPATPEIPAESRVWMSIVDLIDSPGSQNDFVSVSDINRSLLFSHPWSLGGGGASELKAALDSAGPSTLNDYATSIGFASFPCCDDAFIMPTSALRRRAIPRMLIRPFVTGEVIRDWGVWPIQAALAPYDSQHELLEWDAGTSWGRHLWLFRTSLNEVLSFGGKTRRQSGDSWWAWYRWIPARYRKSRLLTFANIATHNHFALSGTNVVYKQTSPVIDFVNSTPETTKISLHGLLNSALAAFWMKQVCQNKGSTVDLRGARQRTDAFEDFFAFDSTKIKHFPIASELPEDLMRPMSHHLQLWADNGDAAKLSDARAAEHGKLVGLTAAIRCQQIAARNKMIALQEELDWQVYGLYGLLPKGEQLTYGDDPPPIELGQRPFEILMARKMVAGELETTWFQRHRSTPITEIPEHWPEGYRKLVERRIELIEQDRNIGLIEQPEYKRRWNTEPWEDQIERAFREWLLDRLESYFDFDGRMNDDGEPTARPELREPGLVSVAKLADIARQDEQFLEVGELYRDDPAFDVQALVAELVEAESVPLLPVLRYKPTGLRKRAEWEKTWDLQRLEDAIDARTQLDEDDPQHLGEEAAERLKQEQVGDIPVPPKYKSSDFLKSTYWRLRGKLDVPKERWVSFPHCEGPEGSLMIAWAGYDHLQLAQATAAHYVDVQERLGGEDDPRLEPLLASLIELLPWLKQWHNQVDPVYQMGMGDYFEGFIEEEARRMEKTVATVRNWQPQKRSTRRKKRGPKSKTSEGAARS